MPAHAFELREGEGFLSANWLEYFDGGESDALAATAFAISQSRAVRSSHAFAIGNVAAIKAACSEFDVRVRIVHEPDAGNESHAAVRRFKDDDLELLELLAQDAWSRVIEAKPPLDRVGPWRARP